jgi:glycerol-3-phosphate dehydrogenase
LQPSITDQVPLLGADGYHALVNQADQLGTRYGLHPYRIRHLLDRYGSLIHEVLAAGDGNAELLKPIPGAPDYLRVEVVYAVSHEGAMHLEDVLTRRTRISIEYPHRGVECAEPVAAMIAGLLGWDQLTIDREIEAYTLRVQAERDSQHQADDAAADASRRLAPEVRPGLIPA